MANKGYLSPTFTTWTIDCQNDVIFASGKVWEADDGSNDHGMNDVEILL